MRNWKQRTFSLTAFIGILTVLAVIMAACTPKSARTEGSTKPQTAVTITAESYAKILNGDLSDFAGIWVNGNGEKRQLRADGVFVSGSMENLNASGFNEYNGSYFWGVYHNSNGFQVTLYPVGVPITLVNEGMGFGETIESDTTKVRIIGSNVVQNGEVYYREGQAPTAETLAAQRQTITQDQTKDGLPKTMYVTSPDGLRGRTEPSLMGSVVKAFVYGQMIVVSEKSSTPTSIDGILDYWYLTSFSGDDMWLFGGYLSDSLPVEKSSGTYAKILGGDFSAFTGTWVTGEGRTNPLSANGVFGNGNAYNFSITGSGYYEWIVNLGGEAGEIPVRLYPVGVEVFNTWTGSHVQTDTTKDRITIMDVVRNDEVYYQPDYHVQFKGEIIYMTFTLLPQMSGNAKIGDILTYLNFTYEDKQHQIDLEYLGPISYIGHGSISISAGDYNSDGYMDLTLNNVIVLYNSQAKNYPTPNDPFANYSPQGSQ